VFSSDAPAIAADDRANAQKHAMTKFVRLRKSGGTSEGINRNGS
jgi:hypothetical protein